MKHFIRKSLYKLLLNENVAQAEKYLKGIGIPLDNEDYLTFKDRLTKDNKLGYLGPIIKIAINNNFKRIGTDPNEIYDLIINNKQLLNQLPKQIPQYDTYTELYDDIETAKKMRIIKKLTDKLTNTTLINLLLTNELDNDEIKNIEDLLKAKSDDRKEFLSKTDKYKDLDSFTNDLNSFIDDLKSGFSYSTTIQLIKSLGEDEIKVILSDENRGFILARILKYSASAKIGSKSWCIVGSEDQYNNYVTRNDNYQYFFFNFNPDVKPEEKMIAYTMDKENKITAAHDRYDAAFGGVLKYLSKLGITKRLSQINSREREIASLSYIGVNKGDAVWGNTSLNYFVANLKGKETFVNFDPNYKDNITHLSIKLLDHIFSENGKGENHLDLYIKKFEDYPVNVLDSFSKKVIRKTSTNIVTYLLNNLDEVINTDNRGEDEYGMTRVYSHKDKKDDLIKIFTNLYLSGLKVNEDTKMSILHMLKDNGVDILSLSKQNKDKRGKDLSDMETAMLNNRGEDLKPIIQNKLAALRRGEQANLNFSEINYAIDNGFDKIIMKYYRNMLPRFNDNQLSYEDMKIYEKLGLFKELSDIIYQKGENYGLDTLNSIEKSIYDHHK